MPERIAAAGPNEKRDPLPDEPEDDQHWALERLGDASIYLVVLSLGVSLVGLLALAVGLRPYGNVFVAGGTIGAMGSMSLATVVATLSGSFSPFE